MAKFGVNTSFDKTILTAEINTALRTFEETTTLFQENIMPSTQ
jgi:hypothetical protein